MGVNPWQSLSVYIKDPWKYAKILQVHDMFGKKKKLFI